MENTNGKVIHVGYRCMMCDECPIIGVRFRCCERPNFDLCSSCEQKRSDSCTMQKISRPTNAEENLQSYFSNHQQVEMQESKAAPVSSRSTAAATVGDSSVFGVLEMARALPSTAYLPPRESRDALVNYVEEIKKDMDRGIELPLLVKSLPLARGSLETQLLSSFFQNGNPLRTAYHTWFAASEQDRTILCSSAVTGAGKTHMAYEVGRTTCFVVLVRVLNVQSTLTKPWLNLCNKIGDLCPKSPSAPFAHNEAKAACISSMLLEALILAYISCFVCVLTEAEKLLASTDAARDSTTSTRSSRVSVLREIVLRFCRNGEAEDLVNEAYEAMCVELKQHHFSEDAFNNVRKNTLFGLHASTERHGDDGRTLVCVDEIQGLARLCECSFADVRPDFQPGERIHGMMYGLLRSIKGFIPDRIPFFLTGTTFCKQDLAKNMMLSSPGRGSSLLSQVRPCVFFTVEAMVEHLSMYWRIDDKVFEDVEVLEKLQYLEGRPYLFMTGCFSPLFGAVSARSSAISNVGHVDKSIFLSAIKDGIEFLENRFRGIMRSYLINGKVNIGDGTHTSADLLATLIDHLLLGINAKQQLCTAEENEISKQEMVETGLLFRSPNGEYFQEPLIYRSMLHVCNMQIRGGLDLAMSIIAGARSCGTGTGIQAESVLARYIALSVLQRKLEDESRWQGLALSELFGPLLYFEDDPVINRLRLFSTRACKVVDATQVNGFCLDRFVLEEGGYDESIVMVNMPVSMGGDVLFLCSDGTNAGFVVIQSKADNTTTFSDAKITLHPATQYLTNAQRKDVLSRKERFTHVTKDYQNGAGSRLWKLYRAFVLAHPSLFEIFIGVVATARNVSNPPVNGIDTLSPLVMLSLRSPRWLSPGITSRFCPPGAPSEMQVGEDAFQSIPFSVANDMWERTQAAGNGGESTKTDDA